MTKKPESDETCYLFILHLGLKQSSFALTKTHNTATPPLVQSVEASDLFTIPRINSITNGKQRTGITNLSPKSHVLCSIPFLVKMNAIKAVNGKYLQLPLSGINAPTVVATNRTAPTQLNQLGYCCLFGSFTLASVSTICCTCISPSH